MPDTHSFPLKITSEAVEAIYLIIENKNISQEYALRLGIQGSGCMEKYLLGFDKPQKTDEVFEYKGLKICLRKPHLMYLLGVELRYEEDEDGEKGFVFHKG